MRRTRRGSFSTTRSEAKNITTPSKSAIASKRTKTTDRMLAVRFEIPQAQLDGRKDLRLRVEDVDGPSGEIVEKK